MTSEEFLFFFSCPLGFSLCQHKMLAEMTLLTCGCAVVLTVVTKEDPTGSLEAVAAHVSQSEGPLDSLTCVCNLSNLVHLGPRLFIVHLVQQGKQGFLLRVCNTVFIKCMNYLFYLT